MGQAPVLEKWEGEEVWQPCFQGAPGRQVARDSREQGPMGCVLLCSARCSWVGVWSVGAQGSRSARPGVPTARSPAASEGESYVSPPDDARSWNTAPDR